MGLEGTGPKRHARRRSATVLAVGFVYLAAVYLGVPTLRTFLLKGREGRRSREEYRVFGEEHVRSLLARATRSDAELGPIRLAGTLTRPSDSEPIEFELLHDPANGRVLLRLTQGEDWWALVQDGRSAPCRTFECMEQRLALLSYRTDAAMALTYRHSEIARIVTDDLPVVYPYIYPDGFRMLLSGRYVREIAETEFAGKPCQIIRAEIRLPAARRVLMADLWVLPDEGRLVKVVQAFRKSRRPYTPLDPAGERDLRSACEVTSFDANAVFDESDFDVQILLRRWQADAAALVAAQIEEPGEPNAEGGGREPAAGNGEQ